ncbi:hypothetical protein [Halorarum salinum]|uniref:Tripartite tricarboxylate transporter TctB family protein n=1 Tax=Halorarum salinum TaxID=2743089 RepID=A0A7D5L869_9EURY|nr:hypothetical protein [Halobaculum salinum]QLG60291.1 hypothetical protein HUG12_00340 [Halobaculum salinum]
MFEREKIDSETFLLLMLLVIAIYMHINAYQYPQVAQRFPQFMSTVVIVGATILLGKNLFPDKMDILSVEEEDMAFNFGEAEGEELQDSSDEMEMNSKYVQVTLLLTTVYIVSGLFVGFYWLSPLFVAVYAKYFGLSNTRVVLLTVLAFLISHVFLVFMDAPINQGLLEGW